MPSKEPKRFEDWEKVDCNECARYWDSSCDGASKASTKPCNSYLATRSVVIPERLKKLERQIGWLEWAVGLTIIILTIIFVVGCLIG